MRVFACPSLLVAVLATCGCSSYSTTPPPASTSSMPLASQVSYGTADQTVLLVSLEDGTVIKQMIDVAADICFKQASNTATTCLTEGAPLIDSMTDTIIGIEMIENQIDLVGK